MVEIVTHLSKKHPSSAAAIADAQVKIDAIIGGPPGKWIGAGGPVEQFWIGQSSDGRRGLRSRASSSYNHVDALIELTSTDGKGADGRNDDIEIALLDHFGDDPRCQNTNSGGGGPKSKSATSRNTYLAVIGYDDRLGELSRALMPVLV